MGFVVELKRQTKSLRQSFFPPKPRPSTLLDDKLITIRKLPIDCLERIFLYIYADVDVSNDNLTISNANSTLFNCAQVNKQWCTLVIPLLWRRPFSIVFGDKQNSVLINTLILFLPDHEKNLLLDQQLKLDTKNIRDRPFKFNYPRLIKLFDYDNFI